MNAKWEPYHQGGVYIKIGNFNAYVVPSSYERDKGQIKASVDFDGVLINKPHTGEYLYDPSQQEELKKQVEDFLRREARAILRELGE